jgi:menaquinone reductase, multiheme cytochrome c subunit
MTLRILILTAMLVVIVLFVATALAMRSRAAEALLAQPIEFNHRMHLEVAGLDCVDCHRFAATQTYAGIPSKSLCLECHDMDVAATADPSQPDRFATLRALVEQEGDIPWVRITNVPDDVFFSHRRHVAVAGLDCRECHADMADRTTPPRRIERMRMSACTKCHEKHGRPSDCTDCHM